MGGEDNNLGEISGLTIAKYIRPNNILFHNADNKEIGRLEIGPPMTFIGDADASAQIFFDAVCRINNTYKDKHNGR